MVSTYCSLYENLYETSRFHKELGLVLSRVRQVTRPNLGLIFRSACYSAGLGLVLSPKISLKLGRVL